MKSGVQILFKFKKKQETDKAKTKNQIIRLNLLHLHRALDLLMRT